MNRIRVLGLATGPVDLDARVWLRAYADSTDGRGRIVFTRDRHKALQFPSTLTAYQFWQQQSTAIPLRDDGQPNRPLTAYCIAIEHFSIEEPKHDPRRSKAWT